ncbi:sulfotransferase [Streptomyces sp. NPDC050523]|uniref:sulfotransferase n=1 Tax=Streptomyces sp. NPDC050523 TaxID=3365622 RepID=UPI00378A981A
MLHLELPRSAKDVIVDKTPPNTLIWPRLQRCWPKARYILLLRHPGAVIASLTERRADPDHEVIRAEVLHDSEKLEADLPSAARRLVQHHQVGPHPARPRRRREGRTAAAAGGDGEGVGVPGRGTPTPLRGGLEPVGRPVGLSR